MVISVNRVCKAFREQGAKFDALTDVSFGVERGRIVGLLGPDGAGKTTLLRILCGLLKPDAGSASVLDLDVVRDSAAIQRKIGYMPQKFGLYENLSIEENLTLYADLHELPSESRRDRFDQLLQMTALQPFRDRYAGNLSGGMKQKLALICALVAQPELLILDEPTVGVDILSRRELWTILRDLVRAGSLSVLVSTAYMDEAVYCDRTILLSEGIVRGDFTPSEVIGATEHHTFEHGFQQLLYGKIPPPLVRMNPVSATSDVLIKAEHLTKKFGKFTAVNNLSFEVRKGEIFGLLGGNGAGKTTMFRMLCSLSRRDTGTIEIAGADPDTVNFRPQIGYMAQKFSLYGDVSVYDNLMFFGGAYGLKGKMLQETIARTIGEFGLANYKRTKARQLPLGCKQRLSMACAIMHKPKILFLDEATSGADPLARIEFWRRIMQMADSGVAIIITTHFMEEAAYCDRMMILQDGMTVACGTAEEIRAMGENNSLNEAFVNIVTKFHSREPRT